MDAGDGVTLLDEVTDRFDGGTIGRGIAVEIRQVTSVGSYRAAGKAKSAVTGNNLLVTYRAAG